MAIVPSTPGPTPAGFTDERWAKLMENARRAEAYTGVAPIAKEGWEIVAVLFMDQLDATRTQPENQS